jgi:hypothetical protein
MRGVHGEEDGRRRERIAAVLDGKISDARDRRKRGEEGGRGMRMSERLGGMRARRKDVVWSGMRKRREDKREVWREEERESRRGMKRERSEEEG